MLYEIYALSLQAAWFVLDCGHFGASGILDGAVGSMLEFRVTLRVWRVDGRARGEQRPPSRSGHGRKRTRASRALKRSARVALTIGLGRVGACGE